MGAERGARQHHQRVRARGRRGAMRAAAPDEVRLVAGWLADFEREAVPLNQSPASDVRARVFVERRDCMLWIGEDGRPGALACFNRTICGKWRSIGPVYTPPEFRCRGMATRLVTHMCLQLLSASMRATLYTDPSNPVPNGIYAKIGFKRLERVLMIHYFNRPD
ncbi:MAG: GNAT family N-acetyltransferase [archaeon]|nr:GNAT family N-acetyltransferase [archaeon]